MSISNFIFYLASNPWTYILSITFIIVYTLIIYRPRYTIYNFTDEQWAVLYKMVEQGMIVIIRLEENKFQIIYDDGRAVNIWHPDFIKFFSFLDIQEMFNIAQVVKHKRRGR